MGLLLLPDEMLEVIFRNLRMASPLVSLDLHVVKILPITEETELLRLRLVCHKFERLCAPLAWRRIQLELTFPEIWLSQPYLVQNHSFTQCYFFEENAHLAKHVRLVSIRAHKLEQPRKNDVTSMFKAVAAALRAMISVRAINLELFSDVPTGISLEILKLQSLRSLRISTSLLLPDPSVIQRSNLRMIAIAGRATRWNRLLTAFPELRCVKFDCNPRTWGKPVEFDSPEDLNWRQLQELHVVDMTTKFWTQLVVGFQAHDRLRINTPLSELAICTSETLGPEHVEEVISVFRSADTLRSLKLYYLGFTPDLHLVDQLVEAFPHLTKLCLLTGQCVLPWATPVDTFAQSLSKLSKLRILEWNHSGMLISPFYGIGETLDQRQARIHAVLLEVARCLSQHISSLAWVKFPHASLGRFYAVHTENRADLVEFVQSGLSTSSWDVDCWEDL